MGLEVVLRLELRRHPRGEELVVRVGPLDQPRREVDGHLVRVRGRGRVRVRVRVRGRVRVRVRARARARVRVRVRVSFALGGCGVHTISSARPALVRRSRQTSSTSFFRQVNALRPAPT